VSDAPTPSHRSLRLPGWHVPALLAMWVVPALPLWGLYDAAKRAVVEEIRQHARGVASAAALGWDTGLLDQLESELRADTPAYRRAQGQLQQICAANPTVRYLYLMRRARRPLAPSTAYEYVVDAPAQDFNGNGRIDRDEESEAPGTFYDAAGLPEMVRGWTEPAADLRVSPDPPYPDVLSGYAPVRDARGWTRALVGVDVTAQTVASKLRVLQAVAVAAWLVAGLLLTLLVHFFLRQRTSLARMATLNVELAERNELLHASSRLMAQETAQVTRERSLHQAFQTGLLRDAARPVMRKLFDKSYLTALAPAGSPGEVFDLDADHVGFYLAQPTGPERGIGLAAHLARTALFAWRAHGAAPTTRQRLDMTQPERVLAWLNRLLCRELASGETLGLIYGVLQVGTGRVTLASAAMPLPLCCRSAGHLPEALAGRPGAALGADPDTSFPRVEHTLAQGDRLLLLTAEALTPRPAGTDGGKTDDLAQRLRTHGGEPSDLFAQAVVAALQAGGAESDAATGGSFLLLHLR
jgi:hypothetical protein